MSSTTPTRDDRDVGDPIRILFVDTDEDAIEAATAVFEDEFGISVTVASSDADVSRSLESVDCVVSEVRLRETSGLGLLRSVRESDPDLPYIFFTEARADDLVGKALSEGATDYLWKGSTDRGFRWLASRVADAVARRRAAESGRSEFETGGSGAVLEGSCLLDESLAFESVGESYAELHGYAPEELVGRSWSTVFPTDERDRVERIAKRVRSYGGATDEPTAVRANGRRFPVRVSIGRAEGDKYVCTATDLAERGDSTDDSDGRTSDEVGGHLLALGPLVRSSGAREPGRQADICTAVVETIEAIRDAAYASVYLYDEGADALRRRAASRCLENAATEIPLEDESAPEWSAFIDHESVFVATLLPKPANPVYEPDRSRGIVVPVGTRGILCAGAIEGARLTSNDHALARLAGTVAGTALDRIDDERRLKMCDQQLEATTETNERLAETHELLQRTGRAIRTAWTRDELEERVCERIVARDRYAFARIADRDRVSEEIRDWASASSESRYLEGVERDGETLLEDGEPTARAIHTLEPQVGRHLVSDAVDERWRQDAIASGYRSVLSVPFAFKERSYGALSMYSEHPDAFDRPEREQFEELGRWIGHALHTIEIKNALIGRDGVELEFRVRDREIGFLEWTRTAECTYELESVAPRSDGSIRGFFTIGGATVEAILELASRSSAVTATRLVTERDDTRLFECTLTEASLVARLLEYGAVPKTITASDGVGRLVVLLPEHADVREFNDVFDRMYPDSTLVRRKDHEYVARTRDGFLADLEDELTEKQFEALEAAFVDGYFDVPRGATGEAVAAGLGVSQPTFNHHLRTAQRNLFSMLLSERE